MALKYRADRNGIVELLRSPKVGDLVQGLGRQAAASVPAYVAHSGETVRADAQEQVRRDRRASLVALVHPSSDAIEAKYGLLARGVAATGLQVRGGA